MLSKKKYNFKGENIKTKNLSSLKKSIKRRVKDNKKYSFRKEEKNKNSKFKSCKGGVLNFLIRTGARRSHAPMPVSTTSSYVRPAMPAAVPAAVPAITPGINSLSSKTQNSWAKFSVHLVNRPFTTNIGSSSKPKKYFDDETLYTYLNEIKNSNKEISSLKERLEEINRDKKKTLAKADIDDISKLSEFVPLIHKYKETKKDLKVELKKLEHLHRLHRFQSVINNPLLYDINQLSSYSKLLLNYFSEFYLDLKNEISLYFVNNEPKEFHVIDVENFIPGLELFEIIEKYETGLFDIDTSEIAKEVVNSEEYKIMKPSDFRDNKEKFMIDCKKKEEELEKSNIEILNELEEKLVELSDDHNPWCLYYLGKIRLDLYRLGVQNTSILEIGNLFFQAANIKDEEENPKIRFQVDWLGENRTQDDFCKCGQNSDSSKDYYEQPYIEHDMTLDEINRNLEVLGIDRIEDVEQLLSIEIDKHFFEKCRESHPDKGGDTEKMKTINGAREKLKIYIDQHLRFEK